MSQVNKMALCKLPMPGLLASCQLFDMNAAQWSHGGMCCGIQGLTPEEIDAYVQQQEAKRAATNSQ